MELPMPTLSQFCQSPRKCQVTRSLRRLSPLLRKLLCQLAIAACLPLQLVRLLLVAFRRRRIFWLKTWLGSPKKTVAECQNKDGVPCIVMIIALSGGACVDHHTDIEVKLVDNGWTLVVLEKWTHHIADIEGCHARHPRDREISGEDFIRRQLARTDEADRVRKQSQHSDLVSVHRYSLPWKAAEVVDIVTGTRDGARTCHIDIYSRQRVQQKSVYIGHSRNGKATGLFGNESAANYSVYNDE